MDLKYLCLLMETIEKWEKIFKMKVWSHVTLIVLKITQKLTIAFNFQRNVNFALTKTRVKLKLKETLEKRTLIQSSGNRVNIWIQTVIFLFYIHVNKCTWNINDQWTMKWSTSDWVSKQTSLP